MPAPTDTPDLDALAERLAAEMRRRWQAGERPVTEDYLSAHPALGACPEAAAELIYEEICLRREHGPAGCSGEMMRRFPQWGAEIRALLQVDHALREEAPDYPEAGAAVGDFLLLEELGRGNRGRVFLARQSSLAGRPVVVKLTPRAGDEHRTLAQLQHTHIVPLYGATDDPARRLRLLCMPYFGGATLAAVLERLADKPPARRTGRDLWEALAVLGAGREELLPSRAEPPRWLREGGYLKAVCRVGACLAEALAFAHERSLLHLDVKPSNVLLTADGRPMLLDFHLARAPLGAGAPAPDWLGGTPGYLPPEQRDALGAVAGGKPLAAAVDGRADVYALGVVLHEALTGARPDSGKVPALWRRNAAVSTGLSDIVRRCLAPRAEDRYPSAAALADDLRRHLAGLPLRGVPNRDVGERWRKWRRRRPHTLGLVVLLLVLVASAAMLTGYTGHRLRQGQAALEEGNGEMLRNRPAAARAAYQRGLAVVDALPVGADLERELSRGLRRAERVELAADLHQVADRLRGLYGSSAPPGEDLAAVEPVARGFWGRRDEVLAALTADRPPEVETQVRSDLLELTLLWSALRLRLAGPDPPPAVRREVLQVLREAERTLGPSPALAGEQAALLEAVGRADAAGAARRRAEETPPQRAWEYYALGCARARAGDLAAAEEDLTRAAEQEPGFFWAQFYLGRCRLERGHAEEALRPLTACAALRPDSALVWYHLAAAHAKLGQADAALRHLDRCLALEPNHPEARALRDALRSH